MFSIFTLNIYIYIYIYIFYGVYTYYQSPGLYAIQFEFQYIEPLNNTFQ